VHRHADQTEWSLTGGARRPTIRGMAMDPLRPYACVTSAWQDSAAAAPPEAESVMGPLTWALGLAVGSLVLVVVLLPLFVRQLPADYFVASRQELRAERTPLGWVWRVLRNLLGLFFVLAGAAMLVLPGQGLLTILIGLLLLDFPGKRALELRLLRRPALRGFLDRMRERRGVPPFVLERP